MTTKLVAALGLAWLAASASFGVPAQERAAGSAGPCFSPQDWVGKYPSEPAMDGRGPAARSFLGLSCIRDALSALLPEAEYRALTSRLHADSPIAIVGRHLIVARCEAHNCPAHHAMIIVDTDSADIVVGIYRRSSSNSRTTWYSTRTDPLELPPEVLQQFLRRHAPK